MEKTTHGLKKPTNDDFYDIQDHNYNTDIIEEHLSDNELHVDAKIVASAQESSVLAQINSSDTNITMWGKLKRAISTLISHISLVASSSVLGHIKIGTGLTMSSGTASVKITDSISTIDSATSLSATGAKSLNDNKAPNNHASTTTIYGIGTSSNFGHTKLSDIYATNVGTADTGKGASSKALYDAYTVLNNSKAPNNHASTATTYGLGNASNYGHVKLSDDYASSGGPAALGVGASSKALYDAYTEINTNLELLKIDVDTLKGKFKSQQIGANSFRYLNFSGIFSCIITIDGINGQSYGSFIANGYGIGSTRIHISKLQAGSSVTCTVLEDRETIHVVNSSGSESVISVFMLYGMLPDLTIS